MSTAIDFIAHVRGAEVTLENVCTDVRLDPQGSGNKNHWDLQTRREIEAHFQKQWPVERAKCRLLHCLCHHKAETDEENKLMADSA